MRASLVSANTAQMDDPAFIDELKAWIRFSARRAARTGDGLTRAAARQPVAATLVGTWMMESSSPRNPRERTHAHSRSAIRPGSPCSLLTVSDKAHWSRGRPLLRTLWARQTPATGIRNAFLNQPVELCVATIRPPLDSTHRSGRPAARSGSSLRSRPPRCRCRCGGPFSRFWSRPSTHRRAGGHDVPSPGGSLASAVDVGLGSRPGGLRQGVLGLGRRGGLLVLLEAHAPAARRERATTPRNSRAIPAPGQPTSARC